MGQVVAIEERTRYPRNKETSRPYRLWNAVEKCHMRWRCYKVKKNAHDGALIEISWAKVGASIEVYDSRNGQMIGQYTMGADGRIKVWRA